MLRNVASQKWRVYAWDTTTGQAKTGDAANISAYITVDDVTPAATNDAAPTEASATNEPGYYDFDLTQAETNGAKITLSPKSGTADIEVIACPPVVYTVPQYHSLLGIESDGDLTKVNTLNGHTAQTGDSYARLGSPTGASVSADVAAVKSETALIVADTNELQTDWADGGRLDLLLDGVATPAEVNAEMVDVLQTDTPIDGYSVASALAIIAATTAGRITDAGTDTETFLGLDEATTRVTVTVDASGNRSDVVYVGL